VEYGDWRKRLMIRGGQRDLCQLRKGRKRIGGSELERPQGGENYWDAREDETIRSRDLGSAKGEMVFTLGEMGK